MAEPISIAWLRQDLRIQDNPVLAAAAAADRPVLPVYIDAPAESGEWPMGGASRWWLHHALESLQAGLRNIGLPLVLRRGDSLQELQRLVRTLHASGFVVQQVISSRLYEPAHVQRDEKVRQSLESAGVEWQQFNASVLVEPENVQNKSGLPYRVFTPFWKQLRQLPIEPPVVVDTNRLTAPGQVPDSLELKDLQLLPDKPWDAGLRERWDPSLAGAEQSLEDFLSSAVASYRQNRNLPGVDGTSSLSPYLHFGQLGPRQVWHATHAHGDHEHDSGVTFLSELAWREFGYHLLHHFPASDLQAFNDRYSKFPWLPDPQALQAWQHGQTGYPFVDAGMRQLWHSGWMHNRVRMVVASFLVKHLLQPWQEGARWFWDTLVDADLASNSMGWQWVAGSGADAAPYFRIFNPFGQGEKFDPDGDYVRQWIPELARLPARHIHQPWNAPAEVLEKAGVKLGHNYPHPIIEHQRGRERALEALKAIRK